MTIKIPQVHIYKPFSAKGIKNAFQPRNIVSAMASGGFLPVIALEAFVEGGRTIQAHKRGGFDEARERITEELSGAIFWLGGVTGLNWVFEKLGQLILKLPKITVDTASDAARNPLETFLATEKRLNGKEITRSMMAKFKFIKVASSVLIANAFIGFALPKINQAITRSYHKNDKINNQNTQNNNISGTFVAAPLMQNFLEGKNNNQPTFKGGVDLLTIANYVENNRNVKLLSVDVGTAGGRVYSARNDDERYEIGFRDVSSVYFYMFNMPNMNRWLNKIEQNGVGSRLDPTSAKFATEYMENYINGRKINVETFAKDVLGTEKPMPKSVEQLFKDKTVVTTRSFIKALIDEKIPLPELTKYKELANKMSKLQPQLLYKYTSADGKVVKSFESVITLQQVKDVLTGGYINDPDFLKAFFQNAFGNTKFMDKYKFVAQGDLDALKKDLLNFVNSIVETAKKTDTKEITTELLKKASKHNFKMNALNWGSGFVVSAAFLSTFIPKMQYMITKLRTGKDSFPGTEQFRQSA